MKTTITVYRKNIVENKNSHIAQNFMAVILAVPDFSTNIIT